MYKVFMPVGIATVTASSVPLKKHTVVFMLDSVVLRWWETTAADPNL